MENHPKLHIGLLIAGLVGIVVGTEPRLMWTQMDKSGHLASIVSVLNDPTEWQPTTVILSETAEPINNPIDPRISDISSRIAIDFDVSREKVYWSDRGFREIMEAEMIVGAGADWTPYLYNASVNRIYSGTSTEVNGVAVDWLSGSIYWTDGLYNWLKVAATGHYDIQRRLVSTGLDKPQGIAVYPQRGMMIWTDWGLKPKVERANLDGSGRSIILETGLIKPQGVTIDYENDIAYWVDDGSDSIHTYDIITGAIDSFSPVETTPIHQSAFFGIALYDDYLFVTDQNATTVNVGEAMWSLKAINKTTRELIFSKPLDGKPYDITMYHPSRQDVTPSECPNLGCQHICVSMGGSQGKCLCAESYELNADGKTCDKIDSLSKPMFLYTIGKSICGSRITINDRGQVHPANDVDCFFPNVTEARALAFHSSGEMLFYSDSVTNTIERIRLDPSHEKITIAVQTGLVKGLAVDWLSDNLYWTDETLGHIYVSRLDGTSRHLLLSGRGQPRGITLDPVNGHMYWTEATATSIWRAGMDGSDVTLLLADMTSPDGIVFDHSERRIYWAEKNGVKSVMADGISDKTSHATGLLEDFQGVTVFADYLAYTDGHSKVFFKVKNPVDSEAREIQHIDSRVSHDIITYGDYLQPRNEPGLCDDETVKCEQLCLPKAGGKVCACAYGYTLQADGVSCSPVTSGSSLVALNFMLLVDPYMRQVFQIDLSLPTTEVIAVPVQCTEFPTRVDYDWSNGDVYCLEGNSGVIKKSPLAGGAGQVVLTASQGIRSFVVSPSTREVLYSDTKSGNILRSGLTRNAQTVFAHSAPAENMDMDADSGFLYWSQSEGGGKYSINRQFITGPEKVEQLWSSSEVIRDVALDRSAEKLYWCTPQKILWSNYDGTDVHVLVTDATSNCLSIAVTDKYIYISHYDNKALFRMSRSGNETVAVTEPIFSRIYGLKDFSWIKESNYTAIIQHQSVPVWTIPNDNSGGNAQNVFGGGSVLESGMNISILIGVCAGSLAFIIIISAIIAVVCRNFRVRKVPKADFETQAHDNPTYATTQLPPPITDAPEPIYHTLAGLTRPDSGQTRPASTCSRDSDLPDVCIVTPSDDESGAIAGSISDKEQLVNPKEISVSVNESKISYNPNAEKF